ncbi:hypothetical protein SAMN05421833_10552 [Microbispora rosea]|uniref:Uncharacterized protein n=1 Tax=Microbispora rosea TaxID=58117 RepID=A0A1N6X833_9ACTN|nr:hypothetical protein [Microbispora rosea]GIH52875.1 hypothetical protein Mro03_80540 [Microbispora rosea subsp. rosea]SIQ98419.1 hypothetical protein SAMN05421833_10552 [Microbispora rosea]
MARRRLTAALLLLLHAIFLTSGGVPASAGTLQTPHRVTGIHHTAGTHLATGRPAVETGGVRCPPAHATRPAQGDPPRVQAGAGGPGASGGPVVLPNPAAPRGGTRVTRAGPHHDGPPAQCPRRAATARAPPSTAY